MRFAETSPSGSHDPLRMSAMIDIVFLLLIFFVMTFRIVPQEGDLEIAQAPAARPGAASSDLPMYLRLRAQQDGGLRDVSLNGTEQASLDDLQTSLIHWGSDGLPGGPLFVECDAHLSYHHIIDVLDHVTGYRDQAGKRHSLISSVQFTPLP